MGFFLSRGKFAWCLANERPRGGPPEAPSCPSKPWRRKMSLARRLSRPKPPEAVAEGQPLQGSGQRRRSAAEEITPISRLIFRPSHAHEDKGRRSSTGRAPSSRRTWACAPSLSRGDFRLTTRLVSRVGWRLTMMSGARGAAIGSARRKSRGELAAGAQSSRHHLVFGGPCPP